VYTLGVWRGLLSNIYSWSGEFTSRFRADLIRSDGLLSKIRQQSGERQRQLRTLERLGWFKGIIQPLG
jgi:hypothetical protein